MSPVTGPFLSTQAAAVYCGMAVKTLRNLMSAGDGPKRYKHGRLNVFLAEDLDEWMSGRLVPAGTETKNG
jgi:predicted DNA-binding transcriptional regulator AlpA